MKRIFKLSRAFVIVVAGIVLLLAAGYCWGFQTIVFFKYRANASKIPILRLTPQLIPPAGASSAKGVRVSHAGFTFELPWADLDDQKSKAAGNFAVYSFRSGRGVMFFGPSPTHEDLLSVVEKVGGPNVLKAFGPETTKSNYVFQKTMLELTPSRLSPWMDEREAARTSILLMIKAMSSVGGETGVFNVAANGWKGFQFDDPAKRPKRVTLELYDSQDQHVELIFMAGKDPEMGVTQPEINHTLQTLSATPAKPKS